jgi:hypothetical protein
VFLGLLSSKCLLVLLLLVSMWSGMSYAQTIEDLQRQSRELEHAISDCGSDVDCLTKAAQKAGELMKDLQSSPEMTQMMDTPCPGFDGASFPSSEGDGKVDCLPLEVRISHKATVTTAGCTRADERFTYTYVFEGLGQLIRDTGRRAYLLNTLAAMPGGRWHLDLQHVEYLILHFGDGCRQTGSFSFGRKDIDFGDRPTVLLSFDHGYSTPGGVNIFFAPLMGWVSPRAAEAHWGIGIPFPVGGGYNTPEELKKAGLTFGPADFEALFEGQALTRNLRWKNTPLPDQTASNQLEIEIRSEGQKPRRCELRITSPAEGHKRVFSSDQEGIVTVDLTAKVKPAKYEPLITWSLPQLDAATRTEIQPKSRKGSHLQVTLRGLPKDISGLGDKAFTATIDDKDCHASATRTVKLFFPREADNNPGGSAPNWFYYWKQTPAARPKGQNVALDYGGSTTDLCKTAGVTGIYNRKFGYKVLLICDLSKLATPFELVFPLLDRHTPQKYFGMRTVQNIDTFAAAVIHEYQHFLTDHNWYSKMTQQELSKVDKDQDGLPDDLEPGLNFDPTKFQTYFADHPALKNVGGDEEWMAYEAMRGYKTGTLDKYDWAHPGNQWKP